MNKKKNVSVPYRNISKIPKANLQQKKKQQDRQQKEINNQNQKIKNRNPSKIPVKQKSNPSENYLQDRNQKSLKEMVQIQIFTDPTNIELTRKKQKQCEEQIKKQIEKKRQEILYNSKNEIPTDIQCTNNELNDFSDSIKENEKIKFFNDQFFANMPPISEEPFIADIQPGSLFDKSTVKTPVPGFSIRKNYLSNAIPTFPDDQNTKLTDTRLDSASEVIYPDGRRVLYNINGSGN